MDDETRGRPRTFEDQGEALFTMTARMDNYCLCVALALGDGNYSEGVRVALRKAGLEIKSINNQPIKRRKLK